MRYLFAVSLLGLLRSASAAAAAEAQPQPPTLVTKCNIIDYATLLTDCENATRSSAGDSAPPRVQPLPQPASNVERPMTNMERIRRGLPLRYNLPKVKKGGAMLRQRASPVPDVTYAGAIQVLDSSSNAIGWVSAQGDNNNQIYKYQPTFDTNVLRVYFQDPPTYDANDPSFHKFQIKTDNSQLSGMDGPTSLIAAAVPQVGTYDITASNAARFEGYRYDTNAVSWPPGNNPQVPCWTLLANGFLTIEYIQPNGSGDAPGAFFTNPDAALLFGDSAGWNTATSEAVTDLQLKFVPTVDLPGGQ